MNLADQGQGRAGNGGRVHPRTDLGHKGKAWAVDGYAVLYRYGWQLCERAVAANGNRRQANGVDNGDFPITAFGERL